MADDSKKDYLFNSTMSLGDHLEELRMRLLRALVGFLVIFVVCLFFGKFIITFIKLPYIKILGDEAQLTTLAPAEIFVSYVKISVLSALIISSPWVFYHLWMFVAAGLYSQEKRYIHIAVPFSVILFVTGALFFLFIVAPICLGFFIKFHSVLNMTRTWTLHFYVSFISSLMLVFGIAFQTPTAIFFLNRTGLVSLKTLRKSRKYILLVIVVIAAMATPPDVVSQVALAIPLYLLFELGILLSYLAARREKTHLSS